MEERFYLKVSEVSAHDPLLTLLYALGKRENHGKNMGNESYAPNGS